MQESSFIRQRCSSTWANCPQSHQDCFKLVTKPQRMIQHHKRIPGDSAVGMRLHRRHSSPRKVLLHAQEGAVDTLRLSVTLRGVLPPSSMHRGCTLKKDSLVYLKKRSLTPEGIATLEEDLLHLSLGMSVTLDKRLSHSGKHLSHTKTNLSH